jgi:hypothetical protein
MPLTVAKNALTLQSAAKYVRGDMVVVWPSWRMTPALLLIAGRTCSLAADLHAFSARGHRRRSPLSATRHRRRHQCAPVIDSDDGRSDRPWDGVT